MFNAKKATATAAPVSQQESPAPATSGNKLPLFFSSPHVITADRHAQARLRPDITMDFARNTNSIPLTMADISEAAKYYPLAFTQGDTVIPVAIVGLEQQNYFIDANGKWTEGCYIPSYVRKYPFVFLEMPDNDQLTLCVDEAALVFDSKAEGISLYEGERPSAFTNKALEFCAAYQEQHRFMREFCDLLKQKDMLSPQRSNVELASGKNIQLNGFQLIDPEKLQALPETEVLDWYRRGFLAMAYYLLQSQSNWRNLLEAANKQDTAAD